MALERDEDGRAFVRVKDLIAYLQTIPPELEVHLDKDGWMEDDINTDDPVTLIRRRGLFTWFSDILIINN